MEQITTPSTFVDASYNHGLLTVSLYNIVERTEENVCHFTNAANALNYAFLLKKRTNRPITKRAMELIKWEIQRTKAISTRAQARINATVAQKEPEQPKIVVPEKSASKKSTLKQFKELKKKHPDAILLFRIGDFYECFAEDAEAVSEILNLTLIKRPDGKKEIYLAGFPHHALDTYLPKLVRAGKRVVLLHIQSAFYR